jgi:hypothetical protein
VSRLWIGLSVVLLACSNSGEVELTRVIDGGPDAASDAPPDAVEDGAATDAAIEDAADGAIPDAPRPPVKLGVIPAQRATIAHLETIAAGSRGVSLILRWDDLYSSPLEPREATWEWLGATARLYADAGRTLLLGVSVVDRRQDARPAGAADGWDLATERQAMEALIDRVWVTFGSELGYFVIGRDLDRWVVTQESANRTEFVAFVSDALDYARAHPSRPTGTLVGVEASHEGWTAGSDELTALRDRSDVVVASYYPVDPQWNVRPPTSPGADLGDLIASLAGDAGPGTVILQEVGYPSAELSGSSLQQQQEFYESFFQTLRVHASRIPFVSVNALDDPDAADCDRAAVTFGLTGDGVAVAGWCSLGLRDGSTSPRPAWDTAVSALADFAMP